jgi:hypothetical protein
VPSPLYHGFEIVFLGRYYQLSRDPLSAELIRKTQDYYPLVYSSPTAVEYSSAPWWKQGWDALGGPFHAPEFAAWLCEDGANRWFADARAGTYQPFYWTVYCAEAWDAGTSNRARPMPPSRSFLVEDKSIAGLRGANGAFSFVGSRGQSVMSFGGCMVGAVGDGYGGYLQVARLGITVPGDADKPYYQCLRAVATPAASVAGSQQIDRNFAALTARFVPRAQFAPLALFDDWESRETWLFTPDGVVAIFEATSLCDDPQGWPEGFIRLGPLRRPHQLHGAEFSVGPLYGKLLNFESFDAVMNTGAPDQNERESRVEIRLKLKSRTDHIRRGEKWSYAAAFFPESGRSATVNLHPDSSADVSIGKRRFYIASGSDGHIRVETL